MKRLLTYLFCASASLLFGCNTTPDPVLTVSPENLAFSAEGGAQTVQVKANNPWTASASGSGLSVNPSSGEGDATVTVTATATSSTNPVSGTVVFRSEGLSATVSVTQDERKVIQVGDVMVIPAEGGTFAVDIQYNTEYTVEVEASAKSWISFLGTRALQSGKLEFQFAENQNTEPRTGKVTVRDNSGKAAPVTLNFVQEEKKVITVGDVMTIPAEGGTFAVDIQYNTDFDVVVESGAQSWITFVATRALKSGKLEFRFAENQSTDPRQGKVTVKDKNGKVSDITLTFVQEEKKVIQVGDVMEIPAEGGTFMVDIQYNTDFDVVVESGAQSWITFVATRALQSGKLEFRFAENQSTDPRQGKVTVKDKSGKVSDITLTFVQAEKKVISVGDVMEIPAEGGTFSVDVQYNTDVVVEVESAAQSWIHFVAVRALTSGKLEFSFDANPNPDARTGKVTVKDKNGKVSPITLTFVQEEKKVITVGDVMEIPAEGGTFSVDVLYNTDVIVEVESAAQSWIHFVAVRALTSGKLEFSFDANPNPDVRTGKVTVKDKNGKVAPITLTFVQAEKKVIAVGDVMEIPAEGGTFSVDVQYNTDVVVEVESPANTWIHFVAVRALTSGKLEFSFDANLNPDIRTGKVTVRDKNGKVSPITLTFVQAEKKVIAVGDVMEIPAEGGTFEVDVQFNTDVVVEVESAAQSWIKFVAVRSLTSGNLEFSFDANPNPDVRTGKVTVRDKNGKVSPITLTFVQSEKKVITVGDVMNIPAEGGTFEVDVQYNTDVVVEVESAAQSWIHFVAVRALTSGKLEFSFDANPNPDARTGEVTVKDKNGKVSPITLTFVQAEKKVIQVGDVMEIPAEGGTFEVDVQYNTDVVVEVESAAQSWIKFVATRSLTSGYLEFSFEANPNPEERTGKVTVKDKSGKVPDITITFVQEEKKVIQVGEVMTIPPEGGTFTVDIQYNTDYKVQVFCEGDWMTYVQTRSLIDGKLEFYFKENKGDRRECYAYVFSTEGGIETIELCFKQETSVRDKLMRFFYAMDGPNWKNKTGWGTDAPVWQWEGVGNPDPETGLMSLFFRNNGLKGEIPDFIDEMNLWTFVIDEPGITGTLPASFGNLVNLESLEISNTAMTSLPDIFGKMKKLRSVIIFSNRDMTGPLPESLGASDELVTLGIDWNGFTGTPPDSWARHYDFLSLWSNKLSGEIPPSFKTGPHAGKLLQAILMQQNGYGFDISDIDVPGNWIPDQIQDIGGKLFTIDDVIKKNKYTVYLYWAPWCPFSKALMPQLLDYYKKYRKDGLEIIATVCVDENGETWRDKARQKQVIEEDGYNLWYNYYFEDYQPTAYPATTPQAEVFDSKGNTLFSHLNYPVTDSRNRYGHPASTDLIPFLETLLGPAVTPDPYSSSDYSKDGEVITLQQATTGKGIDIVFLGDAYTDRDMASGGLYETVMRQAMEEFFAIEPYKTFRNRFNVYAVKAVSKNGMIGDGYTTAFGTYFGKGTEVNGNTVKAFEYALKVPGISSKENILVNIIVNTQRHAGTAVMSESLQSSVAFTSSMGNDPKFFGNILRHEGGGHGFTFLADEYSTNQAMVPQGTIDGYNSLYNQYGWYANVDFTSDPTKIKWSAFLSDSRYNDEVGIYEGGALYSLGVYRPSKNSMMRENFEYYNAPSRWAIYQQIMKRSGESCSFEKFLEYDAVNRAAVSEAAAIRPPLKAAANGRSFEHTAPPVVIP